MKEAKFTDIFRHYIRAHPMRSAAFELKQTKTDSILFSALKEHQADALLAAKTRGILHKIGDETTRQKPFDMCYLRCADAYVVIKYPKGFYFIDIERFLKEQKRSERKSLTSEKAREIAIYSVILKK